MQLSLRKFYFTADSIVFLIFKQFFSLKKFHFDYHAMLFQVHLVYIFT